MEQATTTLAERDQRLLDALQAAHPEAFLGHGQYHDMLRMDLHAAAVHPVLLDLRDKHGFNFLTTLCGIQHPGEQYEFAVVYHLHNMRGGHRIRIKAFIKEKDPVIATATDIWPAANWMEREAWDFFGIKFTGHPDLRRILNMEDFPAFPLRKDYPMEDPTRHDKNDSMFGR